MILPIYITYLYSISIVLLYLVYTVLYVECRVFTSPVTCDYRVRIHIAQRKCKKAAARRGLENKRTRETTNKRNNQTTTTTSTNTEKNNADNKNNRNNKQRQRLPHQKKLS